MLASAGEALSQMQMACGKRLAIINMLLEKYEEIPRASGIAGQTNLLEIFTSKGGSWTLLLTQPRGLTCIVGAGDSWEDIPQVFPLSKVLPL